MLFDWIIVQQHPHYLRAEEAPLPQAAAGSVIFSVNMTETTENTDNDNFFSLMFKYFEIINYV